MSSKETLRHFLTGVGIGAAVAAIIGPLTELLACRLFQHGFRWMDVAITIMVTALIDGAWMIFYQGGKRNDDNTDSH